MSNEQTIFPSINVYFQRYRPGHPEAGKVFISAFYAKGDYEWLAYIKKSIGVVWTKGSKYTASREAKLREVIKVNGLIRVPPSAKHAYYMYIRAEDQCPVCGELMHVFCNCASTITEADVAALEDDVDARDHSVAPFAVATMPEPEAKPKAKRAKAEPKAKVEEEIPF